MKKTIIKSTIFVTLLLITLVVTFSAYRAANYAWYSSNEHLGTSSNKIYSINKGLENNVLTNNQFSPDRIYPSVDDDIRDEIFIPGDYVYYSFIAKIKKSVVEAGEKTLQIDLTLEGKALEGHTSESGDYLSFIHNCTIQENQSKIAMLRRGNDADGEAIYYDPVAYYKNNGSYVMLESGEDYTGDAEDLIYFFDYETEIRVSNTAVESMCPDETDEGIEAKFIINIPDLDIDEYPVYTEKQLDDEGNVLAGTEEDYILFMLYIPIWYKDTGENQNNEMDSCLIVSGCTIGVVESAPEPEPEPEPEPTE